MTDAQYPGTDPGLPGSRQQYEIYEEGIDFKRYMSLFISNWYWFAVALFISVGIAYSINRWSEKIITSSASLLIKDDQIGGYSGLDPIFPGTEPYKDRQNLQNEIGILKSFNLNRRVIDSLPEFLIDYVRVGRRGIAESRLYKNGPFVVKYNNIEDQKAPGRHISVNIISETDYELKIDGKEEESKKMRFGDEYDDGVFKFTIELREPDNFVFDIDNSNRYYFYFMTPESVARRYLSKLSVTPLNEDASLVILSVSGFVIEQEVDYLNTLMDIYLEWGLEVKNKTAEKTIEFIDGQLELISGKLSLTEDRMESFRLSNRFVNLSNEGVAVQEKLRTLEEDRSQLELQKRYLLYLEEYIDSREITGDIIAPSVVGISDIVLERTIIELGEMQQQETELLLTLRPDMPSVKLVRDGIAKKIETLRANVISNKERINFSLAGLEDRIKEVEKEITRLPVTERKLLGIQRDFDLDNTVHNYLLEKKAEAEIALASTVSDNRIIDYANRYNIALVRPREKRNLLIAIVLGLAIPMLLIFLIDYFNDKIIDKRDVEKATGAPILGFISHNDYNSEIPVLKESGSALTESFRSVRTALKYYIGDRKQSVISISSTISSEGKTFISVNLASILAVLGKKVLIVGLDLRKPRLQRILGTDNTSGLSTYLSNNSKYEDVIRKTDIENLSFAPSGPVPPNPAELIETDRMARFLERAKKDFDFIILDTPPVAIVTDALLLAPYSDITIFVVRQRYSSKNTLALIDELYQSGKFKNLSLIINDISLTGYYGYGLRYGYAMRYGGYSYGYNLYGDYSYAAYGYSGEGKEYYNNRKKQK